MKSVVRKILKKASNTQQVHIIGISRSGTTMLQYAMLAFKDIEVVNKETSIQEPHISGLFKRACLGLFSNKKTILLTKRNFAWFDPSTVLKEIEVAKAEGIHIILLVRDPRDVLSSKHKRASEKKYYVDVNHWVSSANAINQYKDALTETNQISVIRYEDLVLNPIETTKLLNANIGLILRDGVEDLSKIKSNIETNGYVISPAQSAAMHSIRDMDTDSIDRWKKSNFQLAELNANQDQQKLIKQFMDTYQYIT